MYFIIFEPQHFWVSPHLASAAMLSNREAWSHLPALFFLHRRSRRGRSDTSTSTAGQRWEFLPRAKVWSTSSPRFNDSSSSPAITPSLYTAGNWTDITSALCSDWSMFETFLCFCVVALVQVAQVLSLHWATFWSASRRKGCWTCSKLWKVYACRGLTWSKLW